MTEATGGSDAGAASGGRPGPFGAPPEEGVGSAAKAVTADVTALVRAEIELAKAELAAGFRPKAAGAALLAAAAALVAVAALALLVAVGFALAELGGLPGWASALIVAAALLLLALVLALVGRRQLATEMSVAVTKDNVDKDVAWIKQRLRAGR